jgi:hypothetical protein
MKDKKSVHLMLVLIVVLGLLILVSGCVPGGADKSGDTDGTIATEKDTVSEVSPIPKIGQDQPFYNFYNKVAINQTKAEVASVLGVEPVMDTDSSYTYNDPATGFGVNVIYSAGGLVTTKILMAPVGGGEWIKLSTTTVTESQVSSIVEGMTYEEVKSILGGDGLELGAMIYPGSKDAVIYTLMWINPDFSSISVAFDGKTGKVLMAEFGNAPA